MTQRQTESRRKGLFPRIKSGTMVGSGKRKEDNYLISSFGCACCAWKATPMCPHGITIGSHTNGICSQRVLYIKDVFSIAHSNVRLLQVEHLTGLKLILDRLVCEYKEGDSIDPEFAKLSKNAITLMDKMRRQDEGLKIQQDVNVNMQEFKDVVEAQAKIIQDEGKQDITRAEIEDKRKI